MTKQQQLQKAKPIILDTESVRAILDGRKTVARQVIKNASPKWTFDCLSDDVAMTVIDRNGNEKPKEVAGLWATFNAPDEYIEFPMIKAKYQVGDILYVRETWHYSIDNTYCYRADGAEIQIPNIIGGTDTFGKVDGLKWRSSSIMPKEATRIFLRVTGVRVQRLQDITHYQVEQEGLERCMISNECVGTCRNCMQEQSIFNRYIRFWNSKIPKKDLDKYGWEANPYVFVYEFERVEVEE